MMLKVMPEAVRALLTIYPSCTLIDGLLKLATIEQQVNQCEQECKIEDCDRQRLCIENPHCCRKLKVIRRTFHL